MLIWRLDDGADFGGDDVCVALSKREAQHLMEMFQWYFEHPEMQEGNRATYVGGWTDNPRDLEALVEIDPEWS
jgi:hypothetical protein